MPPSGCCGCGTASPPCSPAATSLLDPLEGQDSFDYVDSFGALLPPTVILALLGFPDGLEAFLEKKTAVEISMLICAIVLCMSNRLLDTRET